MTQFQSDERARIKRQHTERAISLALENRWEEAAAANRAILELFPADVEAYNRLGKALAELGAYIEAKEAYTKALALDPNNAIAKKNMARLAHVRSEVTASSEAHERVDPRLFIEETGKTGFTSLAHLAPQEVLAKMSAGDQVYLKVEGKSLKVENARQEFLGQVESKLALRLISLIEGGNRYAAAITNLGDREVRIIIREVYQHPSQIGRVSFPTRGLGEAFRPYTKETLLRYDLEEEEELAEEGEYPPEWEAEGETPHEEADYYGEERALEEKAPDLDLGHTLNP